MQCYSVQCTVECSENSKYQKYAAIVSDFGQNHMILNAKKILCAMDEWLYGGQ